MVDIFIVDFFEINCFIKECDIVIRVYLNDVYGSVKEVFVNYELDVNNKLKDLV